MNSCVKADLSSAALWHRACSVAHDPVYMPQWQAAGIEVLLRRDDQVDTEQSGNKFYKLYYNLLAARAEGARTLASFGGAHSNHLHALAAAGKRYGFNTLGVIRGEKPQVLSPTLLDVQAMGMRLEFVSRTEYRALTQTGQPGRHFEPSTYVIAEGGDNTLGLRGAEVVARATCEVLNGDFTALCVAAGTGTTLAGIAQGLRGEHYAMGFSVLKDRGSGSSKLARRLVGAHRWRLLWGFDGGGYGKKPSTRALAFWREFEDGNAIAIEPVYTLKMLQGIARLAELGYWPRGSRIVAVHSGGLQGRRSFAHLLRDENR